MRKASLTDVPLLVALMTEFYAESGYPLDAARAAQAFGPLLADDRLGHVWLIRADGQEIGYVVVTVVYSMEYGGLAAFVDDLFIREAHRHAGHGTAALLNVREFCAARGVRALHVEVGQDNAAAQRVYRKVGFVSTDRQLLTLQLAPPTHAPDAPSA